MKPRGVLLLAGLALQAGFACAQTDPTPAMVLIRPGAFDMGSPPSEPQSRVDETRHQVLITRPYRLAATEVTQAQWEAVMGTTPGYFPPCADCPVERVSWFEAVDYCNALSRREGLEPAYHVDGSFVTWLPGTDGYRLPTEAEWEYACRAETASAFNVGACLTADQANYNGYHPLTGCTEGMNRGEPIEVGRFAPNAWGLYDMHGNINEWCWDFYADYPAGSVSDPRGAAHGEQRVSRGGCWANFGAKCRSANRERHDPQDRWDMIGFRVARSGGRPEARR